MQKTGTYNAENGDL